MKTYLQTLGRKIDNILAENAAAPNPESKFICGYNRVFPTCVLLLKGHLRFRRTLQVKMIEVLFKARFRVEF